MGLHGRRRPRLREPLPAADHAGRDVELTTELGHRLLARHDPLNRCPLEVRAEYPPTVRLPPMLAHGASWRILRPHSEQSKRGALHEDLLGRCIRYEWCIEWLSRL